MMLAQPEAVGLAGALASAAAPWAKIFGDYKAVSAGVLFLHLAPLVFGAGAAFAADRATLRALKLGAAERARQLQDLASIHRVVLFGLTLSFISGILLFLSDVETFLGSVFLWIKLGSRQPSSPLKFTLQVKLLGTSTFGTVRLTILTPFASDWEPLSHKREFGRNAVEAGPGKASVPSLA